MLAALIWIGGPLLFGLIVAAITGGGPQEEKPVTARLAQFIVEKTPVLLEYGPAVYAVRVVEAEQKFVGVRDGTERYAAFPLDKVALTVADARALLDPNLRFPVPGAPSP